MAARRTALAVAATAVVAWPFAEPLLPVLRRTTAAVLPDGVRPVRVLHVSDLHLMPQQRRRAAWTAQLARLRPDLVVSTGDHLSRTAAIPRLMEALAPLAEGVPAFFVPGNTDYYEARAPSPLSYLTGRPPRRRGPEIAWDEVAAALTAVGWTELTHRRVEVDVGGVRLALTGTDDGCLQRDDYRQVAGPLPDVDLGIGVTHTPQHRLLDAFVADGHRLLLAGHTHGGQLRVPGGPPLLTHCDLDRGRARGLSRWGPAALHVSAGLGQSPYLPVRTGCRPEATLLTLVRAGLPGPLDSHLVPAGV